MRQRETDRERERQTERGKRETERERDRDRHTDRDRERGMQQTFDRVIERAWDERRTAQKTAICIHTERLSRTASIVGQTFVHIYAERETKREAQRESP